MRAFAGTLAMAVVVGLTGCSAPTEATATVRIAAASDLKFALDEITEQVEREHPELDISTTYGSSGQFVQQLRNGAPFDVYLSADAAYVQDLVDSGLADSSDAFPYAVGRLVTWFPDGAPPSGDGIEALADDSVRTVAIANPDHAPYGRAAMAALDSAGVRDAVEGKLVLGENVAQAAEFVRSGNADAGIVALSLVLSDPLRGVGSWTEVPLDSYPRLDQAGVVLAGADDPAAASIVREAILSPDGRAVLAKYGFSLPGDQTDAA
jgi:molybdate transport system substrate-binding protein